MKLNKCRVLALETATDFAGVAIGGDTPLRNGAGFAEYTISAAREKGAGIMKLIDRALKDVNLELKDIDLLAVGIGPGLYTGIRIGLSIMKGLAITTRKPLVGISTLDTIAYNFLGCREKIVALLNAYGGEVYGAMYGVGTTPKRCGNYYVGPIKDLLKKMSSLRKFSNGVIFTGTGLNIYRKEIIEILGTRAIFASEESWIPRPASLARLAVERFKRGRIPHPDRILPLYLKKSEAERKWKSFHFHL